jgi:hypothetical protein
MGITKLLYSLRHTPVQANELPHYIIKEGKLVLYSLTNSPYRYFNLLKQLAKLWDTSLYQSKELINDNKFGVVILVLGTEPDINNFLSWSTRMIKTIEKEVEDYRDKSRFDYKRKQHLNLVLTEKREELIGKALHFVQEAELWKGTKADYKVFKYLSILKYQKENLKHKHLKKRLRCR